ncbi:MAG: sugar transferase [Mogibacterium sp.]|nr:sugar transferase [Mogibacterium sp.]
MVGHKQGLYEVYIKRPQDFFFALIAIIVLSPVFAGAALAVRIMLGSPVLFTQERPGLNGKAFKMYKFRTMKNEYDVNGDLLSDEERLTEFGKALRATSIDELPELINIVKGEMSFVGPRPLLMRYLDRYNERQARRHEVRPGITGLAQIHGRNSISWDEKFEWDVIYIDNITFASDVKIVLDTIKVVLKKEGIHSASSVTMNEFTGE